MVAVMPRLRASPPRYCSCSTSGQPRQAWRRRDRSCVAWPSQALLCCPAWSVFSRWRRISWG